MRFCATLPISFKNVAVGSVNLGTGSAFSTFCKTLNRLLIGESVP